MITNHNSTIQMVIVDLDGTLLNNNKKIGDLDFQTLEYLGKSDIVRVFATGRNLYSANNVLNDKSPFDFLVFSSGAGVLDWKTKDILFKSTIPNRYVAKIEHILKELNLNFSIQFPIPDNHKYFFHRGNNSNTDFEVRNKLYSEFIFELPSPYPLESATQFLIILENESQIKLITDQINGFKAIRATSPIDGKSIWLEIFNNDVSKALGCKFLCQMLNISPKKTIGIGNDYNDLDLLDWTDQSYMVSNAPDDIKKNYQQCADNQNNPLSDVISKVFN